MNAYPSEIPVRDVRRDVTDLKQFKKCPAWSLRDATTRLGDNERKMRAVNLQS